MMPGATLDALGNDVLTLCASYLDAHGLAQLGRTSARFGGQQNSLVNATARERFRQSATDEEKKVLPKYDDESDIGLYRALELLRRPLRFDKIVGCGFTPRKRPSSLVKSIDSDGWSTAMSEHVMRGGRHFAEFEITNDEQNLIYLGVIRPVSLSDRIDLESDWALSVDPVSVTGEHNESIISEKLKSQRTAKWGNSNVHCCAYSCGDGFNGICSWTDWSNGATLSVAWEGREGLEGNGSIELLLDLDDGTLSVYKNGRSLGVMKEGLDGEYCWFVTVNSACYINVSKGKVFRLKKCPDSLKVRMNEHDNAQAKLD